MEPDPDAGLSTSAQVNPPMPQLRQQCVPSSHSWEVDSAESAATTSSREQRWELRLKLGQSRPGADLAHLVWRHP